MTILFTSHNLFFVEKWANKMLVLDKGKAIFEGDHVEGLNNPKVKNILGSYEEIGKLFNNKRIELATQF